MALLLAWVHPPRQTYGRGIPGSTPRERARVTPMQGAALIVNARSRTGEAAFQKALDLFGSLGVEVGASHALSDPARLAQTVRHAASEGHDPIIIGGGDGSVSSSVDSLAHHDATLGVLPLGTAND